MAASFTGDGPGVQTTDGCSVELYRLLKYRGELEEMAALFDPGATVLELGCGTGRMTRRLLELGCLVTAVDNSPAMLAEAPQEALRIASDIEALKLETKFDVVVLASYLINHPEESVRIAFVEAARRHARTGTRFLVERHSPEWLSTAQIGQLGISEGVALHVESLSREAETVSMTLRYEKLPQVWRQSFSTTALCKSSIEAMLAKSGFGSFAWYGEYGRWVSSVFH